jgi:hypothetical protein
MSACLLILQVALARFRHGDDTVPADALPGQLSRSTPEIAAET